MIKINFDLNNDNHLQNILGDCDRNLEALKLYFQMEIVVNAEGIFISSEKNEDIDKIEKVFSILKILSASKIVVSERDASYIAALINRCSVDEIVDFYRNREAIVKTVAGKNIYPKTFSQSRYIDALNKNDVIITHGLAGVGKTYLAVCHAVKMFKSGYYKKIILSRPIVEAGESLGYLPGEIKEKIDPYLIPLYDALYEVLGKKSTDEYIENGTIEIAPLAYMRGRTLENAYIILDEAQNTTKKQMKLFLTRLGFNSKMVVTGDITQTDLPSSVTSGLTYVVNSLNNIPKLKIFAFEKIDVVRNPIVQKILEVFND